MITKEELFNLIYGNKTYKQWVVIAVRKACLTNKSNLSFNFLEEDMISEVQFRLIKFYLENKNESLKTSHFYTKAYDFARDILREFSRKSKYLKDQEVTVVYEDMNDEKNTNKLKYTQEVDLFLPNGLSTRQQTICRMLAAGHTRTEIAEKLKVNKSTITREIEKLKVSLR
ncbi:LuxR C-terminal-related transcriptional regulator [Lysinibacillus sp. FSL K6-0075]|uniref:LuxR C-terminal-related transcriptional regulator n=1 Tax=Lysinibacillus sp. FSL K6-0075 TaxID=2921415 RepID=UPI00315874F0